MQLLRIAAITGALAVAIGAFGAHGLKPLMDITQQETFKTGSLYHFFHALVLLIISLSGNNDKVLYQSFYLFLIGIILFSGSLYLISTCHVFMDASCRFLGPVTPLGGLLFIAAWINMLRYPKQ
jgi:uncharacterized membrane protein YgdD (TMEM256/DUF423 family)